MALRFLSNMFEPLATHRRQVTNAATTLARGSASAFSIMRQVRRLLALVRAQDKEIESLRAVVTVMAEQLVELGVDPKVFEYRVEAELDRLSREKNPPRPPAGADGASGPNGGPYRGP